MPTENHYFGHSLQPCEDAELHELHCNQCDGFLGFFVENTMAKQVWEIKITCMECRRQQVSP